MAAYRLRLRGLNSPHPLSAALLRLYLATMVAVSLFFFFFLLVGRGTLTLTTTNWTLGSQCAVIIIIVIIFYGFLARRQGGGGGGSVLLFDRGHDRLLECVLTDHHNRVFRRVGVGKQTNTSEQAAILVECNLASSRDLQTRRCARARGSRLYACGFSGYLIIVIIMIMIMTIR